MQIFYDDHGVAIDLPEGAIPKSFKTGHALYVCGDFILLSTLPGAEDRPEFPGGRLDAGEDLVVGLRREFTEETTLTLPDDLAPWIAATHTQQAAFHARLIQRFFLLDQTYFLIHWPDTLAAHTPEKTPIWIGAEGNTLTWTPIKSVIAGEVKLRHEHGLAFMSLLGDDG